LSEKTEERKCIAVVRVRGLISAQCEARETLDMLRLARTNNAVLVNDNPAFKGMLKRARNYVTWGEASKETVTLLLQKRGRLAGGKKLTDEYAQKIGYNSLDELAEAVANCKVEYRRLLGAQPVFRLHPPTRGFRGKTKKSYGAGGEAGYRGERINELIKRMV
jgi:large subunit ribosomal protein L30